MVKEETRVAGEHTMFVRQWQPTVALERLSGLLATGDLLQEFVNGTETHAHQLRILRMAPHLVVETAMAARVDGKEFLTKDALNTFYENKLPLLMTAFQFVCEVNYKDFFEYGSRHNLSAESEAPASPTTSPT